MISFDLVSETGYRVEVIGKGLASNPIFFVDGVFSDKLFIEECIFRKFSSFRICPRELYSFLKSDPLIKSFFPSVSTPPTFHSLINEDVEQSAELTFSSLPLGEKLVAAGAFNRDKLNFLLDSFQSSSDTIRFGEFLRRYLLLPSLFIDFLVNPSINASIFNNYRIGERLVFLGFITKEDIDIILAEQTNSSNLFARIVAKNNFMLTDKLADFIASVHIDESGEFIF